MNSVKVEQNIYCGGGMIVNNLSELLVRKWNDNGKNLSVSQLEKCSYSELFWSVFPAFGLNIERYGVSLFMRTRITLNTDTFYTVYMAKCFY